MVSDCGLSLGLVCLHTLYFADDGLWFYLPLHSLTPISPSNPFSPPSLLHILYISLPLSFTYTTHHLGSIFSRLCGTLDVHTKNKRGVTKKALLSVNISDACKGIISPAEPIALRLSAKLLTGVVRWVGFFP